MRRRRRRRLQPATANIINVSVAGSGTAACSHTSPPAPPPPPPRPFDFQIQRHHVSLTGCPPPLAPHDVVGGVDGAVVLKSPGIAAHEAGGVQDECAVAVTQPAGAVVINARAR